MKKLRQTNLRAFMLLLLTLLASTMFSAKLQSQTLHTDRHYIALTSIIETSVNIAESYKMSTEVQYFYEGTIRVESLETGVETNYMFYFSMWDKLYKRFSVYDMNMNRLVPELSFDGNIAMFESSIGIQEIQLDKTRTVYDTILSSMTIFLLDK